MNMWHVQFGLLVEMGVRNANIIGFLHIIDVDVLLVGFRSLQPSIEEYGQAIDL